MPAPRLLIEMSYEAYAQDYLRKLPLEHFIEAIPQATQRKIFVASMELVTPHRPDVHVFNEMLVQWKRKRSRRPGQVVADNMVCLTTEPIHAVTSYNVPLEPVGPFWMLEYVSTSNKRKDYDDNFDKYEKELKVPYFLLFSHEEQDLRLYRHTGKKCVRVKPNEQGRYAIPELEMELAIVDSWVRFWFRGKMLPLPADLQRELEATRRELEQTRRQLEEVKQQVNHEKERADKLAQDLAKQDAEIQRLRALVASREQKEGS